VWRFIYKEPHGKPCCFRVKVTFFRNIFSALFFSPFPRLFSALLVRVEDSGQQQLRPEGGERCRQKLIDDNVLADKKIQEKIMGESRKKRIDL